MNPVVGRWNQPDRLGMVDGPNTYDYVRSNPVAYVDPLGFIRIVPLNSVEAAMLSMIIHRQYGQLIEFMKAMGWGAMRGGREVQAVVGKLVNEGTARIVSSSGTAAYRVPDWLSQSRQLLVELKFVNPCNLRVTNQIRDMADWAAKNNYGMTLIVRQSERVHPKVMQALAQLNVKVVELNQFVQKELETIKIVVE